MAKETASIYVKLQSGDAEKNIKNIAAAFRQSRQAAANAKVGSKDYIEATKRVRELKKDLDAHNRLLGRTSSGWANVKTVIAGVFGGNLLSSGFNMLRQGLANAVRTVTDFQDANARLNAVLGETREATAALREQQVALGSSTAFTAGQAAEAQTELAKLGFTIREISNLTPAVLDLAAAAGTDLPTAASIAGSTLRQFGLDSSETQRVVDVMAKSFSSSALDIEKFKFAMTQAAPSAAAAGLSIERTTALIGTLVDRGMRAESAGTGLRAIFGKLAQSGMSWNEAMELINASTNKTKTAISLFGLEASNQALILAQNSDAAAVLEEKLNDAGGAAKKMAEEQLNTLTGDVTKLTSAWEGFILSVENGEGVLSNAARSTVKFFNDAVNSLSSTNKVSAQLQETLGLSYWKDGLLSPTLYTNLAEFQESLNGIADTTKQYAAASDWGKLEGNIQSLRDMAAVIDSSTEEGAGKVKLLEAQINNLQKLRADALTGSIGIGLDATGGGPTATPGGNSSTPTAATRTPEQIRADTAKEALAALKQTYAEEQVFLAEQRAAGSLTAQQYEDELIALKMSSMLLQKEALMEMGLATTDIQQQIFDAEIALLDAVDQRRLESQKLDDENTAKATANAQSKIDAYHAEMAAAVATGVASGMAATNGADSIQDAAARTLNSVRQVIKAYISEAIAASMVKTLATVPFPLNVALATVAGAAASTLFDSIIPAFAKGTSSAPGGMALVGEEGPELVNLPRGSQVFTAGETRGMMGASPFGPAFSGISTPAPAASPQQSQQSGPDIGALVQEIRGFHSRINVVFEKRSFDDFNRTLGDTEKLVKYVK